MHETNHMTHFTYENAPVAVRKEIGETYSWYWQRLASPGSWWTGAERIALAAEVRRATACQFCGQRKDALSPYTLSGNHDAEPASPLTDDAIDAVHRIVTDQSRITQVWVDGLVERGMRIEAYIELVGLVVAVFSIDEFNRALGLAPEALPGPIAGKPTGYCPDHTDSETGFVPMIPRNKAVGAEADLWAEGRGANVLRALSAVPDAVRDWKSISAVQYLSVEGMANMIGDPDRAMNRMQMELVAGRVSAINQCFY